MTLAILIAGLLLVGAILGGMALHEKHTTGSTTKVRRLLKHLGCRWGGSAIIIVGLTLWFAYPYFAKEVEPGDGITGAEPALMDVGVFQTLLLAGIRAVAIWCFSRLLLRKYWPVVDRFLKKHFVRAFYRLTEWQKVIVSLWLVSAFVYLCVNLTH
ncbi:hypothetical protein GCM10011378_07280 [Hymenobacter glacieicola]|uniref:Uncharacterized protein n=2 Tax=Hymenobacter glacieicola TaxID=1562124 RepID=A0ABQ1WK34_9BACT|nr:hypothetical protein GCM10011378_07280 [Hymenobacter glacieicola]